MDARTFGNYLSRMRKAQGLTQAELAEQLHVTDKAVSRWERGIGLPDINTLEPLADALGLTLADLMHCRAPEEAGLFGVLGFLRRGDAAGGLIVVGRQVAVAAVVVLIFMEAVKIIVIHMDSSFIFRTNCVIIHLDYYHIQFS